MQLCFDATRFGLGLLESVELAAQKGIGAVEYTFQPFETSVKTASLSDAEKDYLETARALSEAVGVAVACIKLDCLLDTADKKSVRRFQLMMQKLAAVAKALGCSKLSFALKPGVERNWLVGAAEALNPVVEKLKKVDLSLLLSLATPADYLGTPLKYWRPLEPQEWRDLIGGCPGLSLSFSAADCAWQNLDYLKVLPGLIAAIEHVEANDFEINRTLLADSGLFGPLWWRYRRPGKGNLDWPQFIEALKLYDYKGTLSIHLDDEFVDGSNDNLEESLDESIKFLMPLVKY